MRTIPIDASALIFEAVESEEKTGPGENGLSVQKTRDGVGLWTIRCLLRAPDEKVGLEEVAVPAIVKPDVIGPVQFAGLRAIPWSFNGRAGVALQADSVMPVSAGKRD